MRKMLNKKGFSLVELMIVVVIMGILIAVAIPLYGAITENAEKKTCLKNQSLMKEIFAKYCVMDDEQDASTLLPNGSYNSQTGGAGDIDPIFVESFDGGFPQCPVEGHYYIVTKADEYTIEIQCYDAEGNPAHNS